MKRRLLLGSGLIGLIAVGIGPSISAAEVSKSPLGAHLQRHVGDPGNDLPPGLRGRSWVSLNDERHIVIDTRAAPGDLADVLGPIKDELDGRTIVLEGLSSPGSDEARELDRKQSGSKPANVGPPCGSLPSVQGNGVQAYLGCVPDTGHRFASVSGANSQPNDVMALALTRTLMAFVEAKQQAPLPASTELTPTVLSESGVLRVDFPAAFATIEGLRFTASGGELRRRLMVTALTDSEIKGVEFLVAGECMAFALATGGDDCPGVVGRPELIGNVIE